MNEKAQRQYQYFRRAKKYKLSTSYFRFLISFTGTSRAANYRATCTAWINRFVLGDSSVGFAVFGKLEFESFKGVNVNFHCYRLLSYLHSTIKARSIIIHNLLKSDMDFGFFLCKNVAKLYKLEERLCPCCVSLKLKPGNVGQNPRNTQFLQ